MEYMACIKWHGIYKCHGRIHVMHVAESHDVQVGLIISYSLCCNFSIIFSRNIAHATVHALSASPACGQKDFDIHTQCLRDSARQCKVGLSHGKTANMFDEAKEEYGHTCSLCCCLDSCKAGYQRAPHRLNDDI